MFVRKKAGRDREKTDCSFSTYADSIPLATSDYVKNFCGQVCLLMPPCPRHLLIAISH